jgi:hypothetical protein
LDHGWFCVKLPDTQSGHPQPSFAGARSEETKWFEKMPPWQGLDREAQSRLGTKKLVAQLEGILSSLIAIVYAMIYICPGFAVNVTLAEFHRSLTKSRN